MRYTQVMWLNYVKNYLWIAVALVLYYAIANFLFGYVCPSMIVAGLPCPACGMTRAGILLFSGRIAESFVMHPLFIPVSVFIVCVLVWRDKFKHMKTAALVLILILLIVYVFRMVYIFPHQPPMVINGDSILHNIIFLFQEGT